MPCVIPRSVLCLFALVFFVVGASAVVELSGVGSWRSPASLPSRGEEQIQAEFERTRKRIFAKHTVIVDLLAERLSFREAATRFQELDHDKSERELERWRESCLGDTDEERYCWTVLRFVCAELGHDPVRAREVRQRLEADLPGPLRCLLADFPEAPRAP
jgi:hypothetical protein